MKWIQRLIPRSWRDAVARDIEDEARSTGRSRLWVIAQVARVGLRLRPGVSGGMIMSECRYILRSLWQSKAFAIGTVAVFAVGIGINLATFSVVDRLIIRPLPFADPGRLVLLRGCTAATGRCESGSFPAAVFEESASLATLGPLSVVGFAQGHPLEGAGEDAQALVLYQASPNLLDVLGVTPVAGRSISDQERLERQAVVLLSAEVWAERFQRSPEVFERRVRAASGTAPIVGVLPEGFVPPAWVSTSASWEGVVLVTNPGSFAPIARLADGVSLEQAEAELQALGAALGPQLLGPRARPDTPAPLLKVHPLTTETLFERAAPQAMAITLAAVLLLALACVNVCGLMLARARARERELRIRIALGASRARVLGSSALEATMLSLSAGLGSVLLLWWTGDVLRSVLPPLLARYMVSPLEWRTVGILLLTCVACGVGASLWPAARSLKLMSATGPLDGTASPRVAGRLRGARLVLALQAALGVVIVAGAAGMVRSFTNLIDGGVGLQPQGLYGVSVVPPAGAPRPPRAAPADVIEGYARLLATSREIPGVVGVTGGDSLPGGGATALRGATVGADARAGLFEVSAGYFDVLGSRIVAGRDFTADDIASRADVAMLSRAALTMIWPDVAPQDAVGRTLTLEGHAPRRVVGVGPDLPSSYGRIAPPAVYVPLGTEPVMYISWLVRLADDDPETVSGFRAALASRLGGRVRVVPVAESYAPGLWDPRFRAVLFAAFAVCALVVASAGILALTLFGVSTRAREVGVRMALGASAPQIHRTVLGDALWPTVAGCAVGLVGVWITSTSLQGLYYKVDATDPMTLAAVVAVLVATACVAAWMPARRASSIDPAQVLRAQ
jgi:predicted permease